MWNGKRTQLLTMVMALVIGVFFTGCFKPEKKITVPDVVGMTQAAAESAILDADLTVGNVKEQYSDTVSSGKIISQNPEAETSVSANSAVALAVSKGAEGIADPDGGGDTSPVDVTHPVDDTQGEVTESIDENGGTIELNRAILTIPEGTLQETTDITLKLNGEDVDVQLSENEQAKSGVYTISHDAGFPLFAAAESFSLALPIEDSTISKSEVRRETVYLRIMTDDGSFRLLGTINGNNLQVNLNSLPESADVQVVFNPNMRRVISEIDDAKILTQNPPWRTTRWECVYDSSLSALRQVVADLRGIAIDSVTDATVEDVVSEKVANNARDGANYYQNLGLREANLEVTDVDSLSLMTIHIDDYVRGSHYRNGFFGFGQLNVDVQRIDDTPSYYLGSVRSSITHEMFHACFNGYELNTTIVTSPASKGFNEGLATTMGHTIDDGDISVRSTNVHMLNNSIGAPGDVAYDNDDWFAYVGKRFDDGSLLYVGGHGTDATGASNGLLEQMRIETSGHIYFLQNSVLEAFRSAMQKSFESQFSLNLSEIYWDYARNRAYEHNDESRLRSSDSGITRYSLDTSVFDSAFIANHTFSSDNESVTLSHTVESMLKDVPPLSSRALVFSANGFSSDIMLEFNTSEWIWDGLGNSMLVKVYKAGQDGVELQSDNDEIHLTGFGETASSSVIVLMSNVSLDQTYSLEVTATTLPASEATGAIGGRVTEAVTGDPLDSVAISVREQGWVGSGGVLDTAMTDSNGQFVVENLPAGDVEITFEKDGYIVTTQSATVIEDATTQINATLIVVDTGESTGDAAGRVIDAMTGSGISEVQLNLRAGIRQLSDTSGEIVATTITNEDGDYSFANVNAGTYTVFATRTGYADDVFVIFFVGGENRTEQNGDMSPNVTDGEIRIILTWGATPSDLDSHLTGPSSSGSGRFHVYFSDKVEPDHADLDLDDVSSYGPETTTIHVRYPGTYRFSVHDYSNRSSTSSVAMSNSGANVKIISESGMREFNISPNTPATLWTVLEIDGETGVITEKNEYSFESSASAVSKALGWHYGLGSEVPSIVSRLPEK